MKADGGSVDFDDTSIDVRILDPLSIERGPDGAYPPVCGHSGYLFRPEFPLALERLAAARG